MNRESKPLIDEKEMIKKNPGINRKVVAAYEKAARVLTDAGIEIKTGADYNIEPAFGGKSISRHYSTRRKILMKAVRDTACASVTPALSPAAGSASGWRRCSAARRDRRPSAAAPSPPASALR